MKIENGNVRSVFGRLLVLAALILVCLGMQGSAEVSGADAHQWYTATLVEGEAQGFRWAIGARGPRDNSLDRICALAGVLAPPAPGVPYAEGDNVTVCGGMARATDSVSVSATFGSTGSSLRATLYRPNVRKVVFLLSTGKRQILRPQTPNIPDRVATGIPAFRYLATVVEGGACIRRVTTFNAKGDVLSREGEPCSTGS